MRVVLNQLIFSVLLLTAAHAAATSMTLKDAIKLAAEKNPSVLAAWDAFEASGEGLRASKGGYFPRLDFSTEIGSERTEDQQNLSMSFESQSYQLTLTQMLFDGFFTREDVSKQRFTQLSKYFEFRNISESIALETTQTYLDVLRYRKLTLLAQENYFQHIRIHNDIEDRVKSGFGRGVDLDQSSARLALAKSNLLTDSSNLYDVSSRFQRLTGILPPQQMALPDIPVTRLPNTLQATLLHAFDQNPELNAAIELIRASRADFNGKKSPMMPRLDLRLRKEMSDNLDGIDGRYDEEAIELVMVYNLYRGGADRARRRQSKLLMFEAEDNRDRICREVRQTITIAYNDIGSNKQLIRLLEKNRASLEKAREAYKKQFDIGQRTLLDLLDTENEYFDSQRSVVNVESDLMLAQARTLAGMGELLASFSVRNQDIDTLDELNRQQEEELKAKCPPESPIMSTTDFDFNAILGIPKPKEVIRLDVKFNLRSSELSYKAIPEIIRIANFLCAHPEVKGVVEGHTDSQGPEDFNLELSEDRANSVRKAIVKKCPNAEGRLSASGYGESRNIAGNDTAAGRALNRRVELVLESGDANGVPTFPN